mgnify:FL=1
MIKNKYLLLIAAIVWLIAGFNVLKIGVETYINYVTVINLLLSLVVFLAFWIMVFSKLVKKHTLRISSYESEKQWFYLFFDLKSFIIMAIMMTMGIVIRYYALLPDVFIAVFYTGLGSALALAGILFMVNFMRFEAISQ